MSPAVRPKRNVPTLHNKTTYYVNIVLDVDAFERLLGPCMELMKRNAEDYEKQLLLLFGSTSNITHMR